MSDQFDSSKSLFQDGVVLAVDGGGTKTTTLCADLQGNVIGQGLSGPTSLAATSIGAASFNLRESVRQAMEQFEGAVPITTLVMGLAGMDTQHEHEQASQVFSQVLNEYQIEQFVLVNDSIIALESGTDSLDALVIIAGTGSNCYGHNHEGDEAQTGGMDYLLTDQGSGYMIGRQVMREAVKSYDGRKEKSLLEKLVADHFHIQSIKELKEHVYNPDLTKREVAELAKIGRMALEQGDPLAKEIFDHANQSLVSMATTVIERLGMTERKVDCVTVGGIMSIPYVYEHFVENMKFACHQINIIFPQQEPVFGALKMALTVSRNSR